MRFMLRNVIRDRNYDKKRRANPGKLSRRPMIGGKPLPPASTRMLRLHDFTPKLFDEIKEQMSYGNVALLKVGRGGGEVDLDALCAQLGYDKLASVAEDTVVTVTPVDIPSKPVKQPAPKPAPAPEPKRARDEDGHFKADDPSTPENEAFDPPKPASVEELVELDEPEEDPEVPYTESELKAHTNDDLRSILTQVSNGETQGKGMAKAKLVAAILELQAG